MGELILTSRSSLCKEGQHVNIDRVDGIEDILSSSTLLITTCTIALDIMDNGKNINYPYASSETVTGMRRLDKLLFA